MSDPNERRPRSTAAGSGFSSGVRDRVRGSVRNGRLKPLWNLRYWLAPGMGVKRHFSAAVAGALIAVIGVATGAFWLLRESRGTLADPVEAFLSSGAWSQWGMWLALLTIAVGIATSMVAVRRLNASLLSNWVAEPNDAAEVLHRRLELRNGPRVVALGGGTGLSNLLRGLRQYSSNVTAVVTVTDDGGSSGRLRKEFDMPAPGDLSDCLAALSDNESELSRLLEYRFERGRDLQGHTFGNLIITTLTEVEGDFGRAIHVLNSLLNITGAVYPSSAEPLTLEVLKASGETVAGESRVREVPGAAKRVSIRPSAPAAIPEVPLRIREADVVVLGPGSLFTSTIPPLLVPEIRKGLCSTAAKLVYICNIMTEAGETDGFSAWQHVEALEAHLGRFPDVVVVNVSHVDEARARRYREERAEVVAFEAAPFREAGIAVVGLDLLGGGVHAQHDSARLAEWIHRYCREQRTRSRGLESHV